MAYLASKLFEINSDKIKKNDIVQFEDGTSTKIKAVEGGVITATNGDRIDINNVRVIVPYYTNKDDLSEIRDNLLKRHG